MIGVHEYNDTEGHSPYAAWFDFGKDGESLVILLGGGSKKRQQRDIEEALANWRDYKRRKR